MKRKKIIAKVKNVWREIMDNYKNHIEGFL